MCARKACQCLATSVIEIGWGGKGAILVSGEGDFCVVQFFELSSTHKDARPSNFTGKAMMSSDHQGFLLNACLFSFTYTQAHTYAQTHTHTDAHIHIHARNTHTHTHTHRRRAFYFYGMKTMAAFGSCHLMSQGACCK
jgi:hypothetical protein